MAASLRCAEQHKDHIPSAAGMPMTALLCWHCSSQHTSFATRQSKSECGKSPHGMHGDFQKNKQEPKVEGRGTEIPQSPMSRSLQAEREKAHSSLLLLPSTESFSKSPHQSPNPPLTSLSILNVPSFPLVPNFLPCHQPRSSHS